MEMADRWKLNLIRRPAVKVKTISTEELNPIKSLRAADYAKESDKGDLYERLELIDKMRAIEVRIEKNKKELNALKEKLNTFK